jgi:outer membrane protein assembly factor BamB
VLFDALPARVVAASAHAVSVIVPPGLDGGRTAVRVGDVSEASAFVDVGRPMATGVHLVDSPVIDGDGTLFVTYSGSRGEKSPVSVFRVRTDGYREPFVTGIVNATSMALSPDGRLHVSSRFEGTVYRVADDGSHEVFASELGVACGMAFSQDGTLYVGDRSGTVFRVATSGRVTPFATLPPSVAAFHLAWGPDDGLYVAGPTLATCDSVCRIDRTGAVTTISSSFGRPQGLAFDRRGALHVVEALAGASGLYRLAADGTRDLVLAAGNLVGIAFDPSGGLVAASGNTAYRLDPGAVTIGGRELP